MTEITINRTCAMLDRCEQFTSGSVGARIKFSFSSEWAGLSKTAVFTNGDTTIDVLNVADEITIPHEVLAISGKKLKVGVYGFTVDDHGNIEIAIPTVYAELGKVVKGADPSGDESTEPSLPVWAQMQSDVSDLDTRVTELEEHGGGGTSDHSQLTNRDAANQHPITAITGLQTALDGKADAADIPSLAGYATEGYVQNYHDNTKQDIITDLASIRSGAALGATALQSVPNTYALKTDIPTKTSELTNDSGFLTEHQSLAGYATEQYVNNHHDSTKQDVISDLSTIRSGASKGATAVQPEAGKGLFSGSYNDLTDKPVIPDAVTEGTVSGWGFTKNTGTYSKPTGGIPKADLAEAVQTSLGKADTALQEHQSLAAYRTAAAQDIIDNGKQDKITSTNKLAYSLISGTPTIPTVPTNVSAFTNDAGYLTLATLPKYEGVVE